MAEAINTGGIRPVTLPNQFPPMPAVARILSRFDREQLHGFIAVAIDLADALDGDPDIEMNGDELDGTAAEDDFYPHGNWMAEPGCPISDPDCAVDDKGCDDIADDREPEDYIIPAYGEDQSDGPIPAQASEDRGLMLPHLRRIRSEACDKLTYGGTNGGHRFTEYRVRSLADAAMLTKAADLI